MRSNHEKVSGERLAGILHRLDTVADSMAARIRDLEYAEAQLREQDPTYCDARIAAEYRALFGMLERLAVLGEKIRALLPSAEEADGDEKSDPAMQAVRDVLIHLVKKRVLPAPDPILAPEEVEEEYRGQLQRRTRQERGLRPR